MTGLEPATAAYAVIYLLIYTHIKCQWKRKKDYTITFVIRPDNVPTQCYVCNAMAITMHFNESHQESELNDQNLWPNVDDLKSVLPMAPFAKVALHLEWPYARLSLIIDNWGWCWSRTNLLGFADQDLTVRTINQIFAEKVGFEPTGHFTVTEDFKSTPLWPLRHLSKLKFCVSAGIRTQDPIIKSDVHLPSELRRHCQYIDTKFQRSTWATDGIRTRDFLLGRQTL